MNLNQTDLIVSDVLKSAEIVQQILAIKPDVLDERFTQFTIGNHCLMLSPDALIPMKVVQSGTILHIEVEDVEKEFIRIQSTNLKVLMEPTVTDWGTYSLLIQGPEETVFDLYQFV
jgi:hypothetical protein